MKTFMKYFAVLFVLMSSHAASAESVAPSNRVREWITIYSEPSAASPKLGQLEKGSRAPLVQAIPFWYEITLPSGQKGYVSRSWSRRVPDLAPGALAMRPRAQDELRVHFVHTGPGSCAVVECPGSGAPPMVVDCGRFPGQGTTATGMDQAQAAAYIQNVLAAHGTSPNVVLSHADYDHYAFIPAVMQGRTASNIWMGGKTSEYSGNDFPAWLLEQRRAGANVHEALERNYSVDVPLDTDLNCGLASTYVLNANIDTSDGSKNNDSLVLLIEYGDFRIIFTGDAEGSTEDQIRANYEPDVQTTVLTGSHHGAQTHRSNSVEWVAATKPNVVVYNSGHKYGHPKCQAVKRYQDILADAPEHEAACDTAPGSKGFLSSKAEYMTERSGNVVITSGGRSPLWVDCSLMPECHAAIEH